MAYRVKWTKPAKVQKGHKWCPKCGRVLPTDKFNRKAKATDGLQCWCKECQREYARNKPSPTKPKPSTRKKVVVRRPRGIERVEVKRELMIQIRKELLGNLPSNLADSLDNSVVINAFLKDLLD